MSILFSPIGNSDPWRDMRDGAMLHIVRHFKPKVVYLFFTESIWEDNEKRKGHKHYEWERIIQSVNPGTEVIRITEKIEKENDFDAYKDLFHEEIKEIHEKYPEEVILLNVTSGTPQMSTTLCLEYVTYPNQKKAIQVDTPLKSSNAGLEHANISDMNVLLELVNDAEDTEEKRAHYIDILSFRHAMMVTSIIDLIDNYDYVGAIALLKQLDNKDKLVMQLSKRIKEINNHMIFSEINKRYTQKELKQALSQFLILQMRYNQRNFADVLVRIKSIAEFCIGYYLIGEGYLRKHEGDFYLKDKYQDLKEKVQKKKDDRSLKMNLPIYEKIINILYPDSKLSDYAADIMAINDSRNSVAHNLEALDIEERNLKNALAALKQLLEDIFPDIQDKDFYFLDVFNKELKRQL